MDYRNAGVDTELAGSLISNLKQKISSTYDNLPAGRVTGAFGGFAGAFAPASGLEGANIVASTDGVGTKIELYRKRGNFQGIGQDLVAMCVNDLYCIGGIPAFFLDYIACGKLDPSWYNPVVSDIADACREAQMALLGGETAEHPGVMKADEFDLAGFCVGFQKPQMILPRQNQLQAGDTLLALPSSGLHSNGFSLVRKIIGKLETENDAEWKKQKGDDFIGKHLLAPTRIYREVTAAYAHLKGMVHITGGGFYENIPRILPDHLDAVIEKPLLFADKPAFSFVRRFVSDKDCFKTFNMGCGMMLVAGAEQVADVRRLLPEAEVIGQLASGSRQVKIKSIDF